MVNGVPRDVPRPKPEGFGCRNSIHHDTPKAFPHIFILLSFRTSKEGFLSANGVPRNTSCQYAGNGFPTLVELNPNILIRDVERMQTLFNPYRQSGFNTVRLPCGKTHSFPRLFPRDSLKATLG